MLLSQSFENIPEEVMLQTRVKRSKKIIIIKRCSKHQEWAVEQRKWGTESGLCGTV